MAHTNVDTVVCNFCGKVNDAVGLMIKASDDCAICDECVDMCVDIIREERSERT